MVFILATLVAGETLLRIFNEQHNQEVSTEARKKN